VAARDLVSLAVLGLVRLLFGRGIAGPPRPLFGSCLVLFFGIKCVVVQFLNSMGYPRIVVMTWFVCMCVNIFVNSWVVPVNGIIGVSLTFSITYMLASVLVSRTTSKTGHVAMSAA